MHRRNHLLPIYAWTLTFWIGFTLLTAVFILISMVFLQKNAPGIYLILDTELVSTLNQRVLNTMNGIAILLNASVVSVCLMSFYLMFDSITKRSMRSFWILTGSLLFLQVFGFISDTYFFNLNLFFNALSSIVLLIGLYLCFREIHPKK